MRDDKTIIDVTVENLAEYAESIGKQFESLFSPKESSTVEQVIEFVCSPPVCVFFLLT